MRRRPRNERGAQPADGHAHLVHAFCIARQRRQLVRQEMAEPGDHNIAQCLGGIRIPVNATASALCI
jgi:hypothetical protein